MSHFTHPDSLTARIVGNNDPHIGSLGLALKSKIERDLPKCSYCDNFAMSNRVLCETCEDVEFCCNVSKDKYATKRLAYYVALYMDMPADVLDRLRYSPETDNR